MALGPLARVMAQFVVVAGGAVGRAVLNAYKEAAARGAANSTSSSSALSQAISRRMSIEEAGKILDIETKSATVEKVIHKADHLQKVNQPLAPDFSGSPYIQRKVDNAKTILLEHLHKPTNPPPSAQA